MNYKEIYTIEINLDDDFANACAYHIDDFKEVSKVNLRAACEKVKGDRWVVVGLANSLSEASDKTEELRRSLCKMHNKKPYGISEIIEKD